MLRLFVCLFVAYRPHVTPRTRDESRASLSGNRFVWTWWCALFVVCLVESKIWEEKDQDKKTEKIEMLQSHEALLQKRREQARARRNTETSEQRRIRLQRNRRNVRRTEQLPNENNACKLLKNGCRRSESTELYNNRKFLKAESPSIADWITTRFSKNSNYEE